jgi:hypothetical protein
MSVAASGKNSNTEVTLPSQEILNAIRITTEPYGSSLTTFPGKVEGHHENHK